MFRQKNMISKKRKAQAKRLRSKCRMESRQRQKQHYHAHRHRHWTQSSKPSQGMTCLYQCLHPRHPQDPPCVLEAASLLDLRFFQPLSPRRSPEPRLGCHLRHHRQIEPQPSLSHHRQKLNRQAQQSPKICQTPALSTKFWGSPTMRQALNWERLTWHEANKSTQTNTRVTLDPLLNSRSFPMHTTSWRSLPSGLSTIFHSPRPPNVQRLQKQGQNQERGAREKQKQKHPPSTDSLQRRHLPNPKQRQKADQNAKQKQSHLPRQPLRLPKQRRVAKERRSLPRWLVSNIDESSSTLVKPSSLTQIELNWSCCNLWW